MLLGKSEDNNFVEEQFQGSVTGVQVFTVSAEHSIRDMSSQPCTFHGDLLAWRAEDWRVEGEHLKLVEESKESFCDQGTSYTVAIPVSMGIHEGMDLCRKKLNNSIIPTPENLPHLQSYVAWYQAVINCANS